MKISFEQLLVESSKLQDHRQTMIVMQDVANVCIHCVSRVF